MGGYYMICEARRWSCRARQKVLMSHNSTKHVVKEWDKDSLVGVKVAKAAMICGLWQSI